MKYLTYLTTIALLVVSSAGLHCRGDPDCPPGEHCDKNTHTCVPNSEQYFPQNPYNQFGNGGPSGYGWGLAFGQPGSL
ncbi:hypothetical protein RSOLAG22IIIB_10068 [Rhizoctonia solani]|uniref:Secreted protein n=1 Tax=Rhizoctonia solani TaxID=456999 RepID=A0A0K6G157_9AGAM|nr:hypothetical protein RSOLAG22IIIB_10068 [Rhizoctonia solani]